MNWNDIIEIGIRKNYQEKVNQINFNRIPRVCENKHEQKY